MAHKLIQKKNVLISIYAPIDAFPPTINLIHQFCVKNYNVYAIEVSKKSFYHSALKVFYQNAIWSGDLLPIFIRNYFVFFKLLINMIKIKRMSNCKEFIVFDAYTLMAYVLLKKFGLIDKNSKVWYHNHDVALSSIFKFGSLGRIAHNLEKRNLKYVDFFTLPSQERSSFFTSKNTDFVLPNYPSIFMYGKYKTNLLPGSINLIFQGRITHGHGIEAIIDMINLGLVSTEVSLVLKGIISNDYKEILNSKIYIDKKNRLSFIGYTEYEKLPEITASCQIGVAIFQPKSFMDSTLGTSSNKIYEYVACGLPIIYLGTNHFKKYLSKYDWAFAVDDNPVSISNAINTIINNYAFLSKKAKESFVTELNYESFFNLAYAEFSKIS